MEATLHPALLLLLADPLFWAQTCAGSHSLLNFTTVVSRPGLGEPRFIFVGYVDNTQLVRFDSVAETPRVEPCVGWMEQERPEYWELQTQMARTQAQLSGANLMTLLRYFNQSEDDSHTLQGMRGCKVGQDGLLLHWYNQLAFDGEDCLNLNEDWSSWAATRSTLAQISQLKLGDHLKGNCVDLLQKHLEKGKDMLLRSGGRRRSDTQESSRDSGQDSGEIAMNDEEMVLPFWNTESCRNHPDHFFRPPGLLNLSP